MRKIFISLFFIFFFIASSHAEAIRFKDGKTVEATILEKTNDYIKVDFHGVFITYYLSDIDTIDGNPVSTGQATRRTSSISNEKTSTNIFERIAPAVVVINASVPDGSSQGSGFIVDQSGVIVTNFHVVAGAEEINVRLKDGRQFSVSGIINYHVDKDICILKIEARNLPTVTLGNSNFIQPGTKVFVIGAPLGYDYSITDGLYSGKRRSFDLSYLQFSAPISPGNSGGPLLDGEGKVVGITTLTNLEGQNMNFALPINEVKKLIETFPKMSMEEYAAKVSRAYPYYKKASVALYSNKDYEGTIRYLQRAVEIDPNFIDAHIFLASAYYVAGNRFDEAVAQLKKALTVSPNNPRVLNELGGLYAYQGMHNLAIEELKKAVSIDPQFISPYINLSYCYEHQDRLKESSEMLKVALSIDRDDADVHLNIGWLYHRLGKDSQAIEETQRAIALDPYNALAHHNLSVIYFGMGKYDNAVKYYDEALNLGRPADNEYLEKLKPYRKSKEPFSPKAWRKEFFSHVVFTDDQRERALNRLDKETSELRQAAANAVNQGDYVLGSQYLERALLHTQAGTPEYYYILEGTILYYFVAADSYYDKGLYDTAIDYMNKAIMIMGTAPADFNIFRAQCYVELVDFYAKKGDTARMREYIQKIHPLYPEAAYALAREYALEDIFKK